MENVMIENIRNRIEELGLTIEGAAKECGLSRDYFRKLFDRPNASPRGVTLKRIADGLKTTPESLMNDQATKPPPPALPTGAIDSIMPYDVKVMGTAAGSHIRGAFQLTPGPIDVVRRPPALLGAPDVYALYVEGSSMEPRFPPGELIYVHPKKPLRANDAVVVQCYDGSDGDVVALIGIYLKKTETDLVLRKYNPLSEVRIPLKTIKDIHRVLTTNELFGV